MGGCEYNDSGAPGPGIRSSWAGTAEGYDQSFARLCVGTSEALIAAVRRHVWSGRVLDVGAGTGRVAAAFAAAGFGVQGLDADPGMVAAARRRLPAAQFGVAFLPALRLPSSSVDATVANFVINHVSNPRAGVREMLRVTRPDGLVLVTVWPSEPVSELNQLWSRVLAHSGVTPPPPAVLPPEQDFDRNEGGVRRLLVDAGGCDVEVSRVGWKWRIAPGDLWRGVEAGVATIGAAYLAQTEQGRLAMRTSFEALTNVPILWFDAQAVLGVGRVSIARTGKRETGLVGSAKPTTGDGAA